jgi:rubrerythrin
MDVVKVYQYALLREREGKRFFEDCAGRVAHAAAVQAFRELIAEEEKHIEFITRLLQGLKSGGVAEEPDAGEGFFSRRAASEFLDQTVMESMVPDLPVLRMAYLIERDFVEFYSSAAEAAEGEAKRALSILADWERVHEKLFKNLHDRAMEAYDLMPWGG